MKSVLFMLALWVGGGQAWAAGTNFEPVTPFSLSGSINVSIVVLLVPSENLKKILPQDLRLIELPELHGLHPVSFMFGEQSAVSKIPVGGGDPVVVLPTYQEYSMVVPNVRHIDDPTETPFNHLLKLYLNNQMGIDVGRSEFGYNKFFGNITIEKSMSNSELFSQYTVVDRSTGEMVASQSAQQKGAIDPIKFYANLMGLSKIFRSTYIGQKPDGSWVCSKFQYLTFNPRDYSPIEVELSLGEQLNSALFGGGLSSLHQVFGLDQNEFGAYHIKTNAWKISAPTRCF